MKRKTKNAVVKAIEELNVISTHEPLLVVKRNLNSQGKEDWEVKVFEHAGSHVFDSLYWIEKYVKIAQDLNDELIRKVNFMVRVEWRELNKDMPYFLFF